MLFIKESSNKINKCKCYYIAILICFFGCNSNRIPEYLRTDSISNHCFIEHFNCRSGGVYSGDTYICYITDSNSFRKKIDIYDDDEIVECKIKDGKAIVKIRPRNIYGLEEIIRVRCYEYIIPSL